MFLKNAWYIAAWSDEIGRELMSRTLLGERVVMYRTEGGEPVALLDRCAHRFVPLHIGKLHGDVLQCGYHGLRYDKTGACVFNPHGSGNISRNMKVRRYPLVERDGLVWIWMGEAAKADPATVLSFPFLSDTEHYTTVRGFMHVKGHYEIINDNLLDLSHTQYVHPIFLNPDGQDAPRNRTTEVGQDERTVWERSVTHDSRPIPFARMFTDRERVDAFITSTWHAPSIIHLDIGTNPVGEGDGRGPDRVETPSIHFLTPETESSTHYWWTVSRNVKLDDEELSQRIWKGIDDAFAGEDKPIIEMQQLEIAGSDLMSLRPVLLETDARPMRARAAVKALLAAENAPPAVAAE